MTLSGVQPTPPSFPPSAFAGHLGQQVFERTLPQGPRLLMVERHTVPLVYFSWVAPAGIRHEPPGLEGIATLAAHTLGGRSGLIAGVDRDCAVLGIGGLNDEVANSLDALFDALLEPEIDPSAFETLRARLLHELEQRRRQLDSLAEDLLAWALFGPGPDGRPKLGLSSGLQRIDPAAVRRFVEQRRTATGATLLIAGDFDSQRMGDYLETLAPATLEPLGMESSGPPEGSAASSSRMPSRSLWKADDDIASTSRPILVADLPEARHSVVRVGWPGPSAIQDDVFIARTLAALLAGPVSSRLGDRLRHREGWVYHIAAKLPLRLDQAPFTLAASLAHDRAAPVLEAIRDEVTTVQQEGPREREVEGLRTYLTGVGLCGCQTLLNTLGRLRRTALDGADPLQRELTTLASITADDLQNLAQRVLDPRRRVEVVVGPLRQLRPTLETLGPVMEVDPGTFFDPEAGREPKHLRS